MSKTNLTTKELLVYVLVVECAMGYKQIAAATNLSVPAVKGRLKSVGRKLGVTDLLELLTQYHRN